MKKIINALRFLGVWLISFFTLLICAPVVFPSDQDGHVIIPAIYGLVLFIVPIALGVLTLKRTKKDPIGKTLRGTIIEAFSSQEKLYDAAVKAVLESGQASVSMVQRRLHLDYQPAAKLMEEMEKNGVVSAFDGVRPRKILITSARKPIFENSANSLIYKMDTMEGHEFEYFCADLLRKNNFINVEVTPGSGDQGVDVLAEKDGIKYAIQCKCYSSDLGNKPIQEVNTGKTMYHCQIGAVMTNRYFTQGAKAAAAATGILLWDRDKLVSLIGASGALV